MTDNLAAENLAVLLTGDNLDETLGMIDGDGLAVSPKRHPPDFDFDTLGASFRFAETDRRDARLTVNTSGNREQIKAWFAHAGHDLYRRDTFGRGLMRQQGR